MRRYRLSRLAERDIARILATSEARWGPDAPQRYAAIIAAALRSIAGAPRGPATRDCSELLTGVRSMHLRGARGRAAEEVRQPVHVIYFRTVAADMIEIIRVLHERMEPARHLRGKPPSKLP